MIAYFSKTNIGYSHRKEEKPCQDYSACYHDEERTILTACASRTRTGLRLTAPGARTGSPEWAFRRGLTIQTPIIGIVVY